jgi:hypothetical protein
MNLILFSTIILQADLVLGIIRNVLDRVGKSLVIIAVLRCRFSGYD